MYSPSISIKKITSEKKKPDKYDYSRPVVSLLTGLSDENHKILTLMHLW